MLVIVWVEEAGSHPSGWRFEPFLPSLYLHRIIFARISSVRWGDIRETWWYLGEMHRKPNVTRVTAGNERKERVSRFFRERLYKANVRVVWCAPGSPTGLNSTRPELAVFGLGAGLTGPDRVCTRV